MRRIRAGERLEAVRVLAIDVGSSSARAALFDEGGSMVSGSLARVDVDLALSEGGVAQIDATALRHSVERTIDATLASPAAKGVAISVVSMTTFWHSLVALDEMGYPLTPVLTWADTRSEADALRLRAALDNEAIHQRTGCILHPSYLPAKIAWLRRQSPSVLERAASLVSFAQYCSLAWLGTSSSSVSMASGSGLFDHERGDWDEALLEALQIDPAMLGSITPGAEMLAPIIPTHTNRWPALAGVPWRAPIGDGAASNLGVDCATSNRLALMIGTSGALRRCEPADAVGAIPPGLWRYRPDRRLALTGGALSDGGNVYDWLRHTLRLPSPAACEAELANRAPGEHRLVVLPFWSGERSPGWVGDATAMVAGFTSRTTPMDIFHASLEAVAHRFAALFELMRRDDDTVVATGGALRASPAWSQIIADALGCQVAMSTVPEASLRGAAFAGLAAIGVTTLEEASQLAGVDVREPRMNYHALHLEGLRRQQEFYDREIGPDGTKLLARQTRRDA